MKGMRVGSLAKVALGLGAVALLAWTAVTTWRQGRALDVLQRGAPLPDAESPAPEG